MGQPGWAPCYADLMKRILFVLAPFLMAPTCGGGGSPGFGGGGTPAPPDPADTDTTDGGGGGTTECEPEYEVVEVTCSTDSYLQVWHFYVEMSATCPWIDVKFDGTSWGGQITGSEGIFDDVLSHTGASCDEPHTIDLECLYMLSNYDCSYEYTP
jgi:hypothetical protein